MLSRSSTLAAIIRLSAASLVVAAPNPALASEPLSPPITVTHLLSGASPADDVRWQFARGLFVESSDSLDDVAWETIPVPSNWELEGLGTYSYGRGEDRTDAERRKLLSDVGTYRHTFTVPQHLLAASNAPRQQRRFFLRFRGVMTDARVFLNGQRLATTDGATEHRGGFTPFSFEVTDIVALDQVNELVVAVREESVNESINRAERDADYWLFGGIFRPVELISKPLTFIETVAVDAQADGRLLVQAQVNTSRSGRAFPGEATAVEAVVKNIRNPDAVRTIAVAGAEVNADGIATIELKVEQPRPWSAERPNLYSLEVRLGLQHQLTLPIGFRTVEVRTASTAETAHDESRTGFFVNGERVILRGINRHSFWPDTGRALSAEQNRRDVELIKELGFNAVRSSHYPPDQAFLDACDELGLYVIDELPGWHDGYDSATARRLTRAMVERDRNHPSIVLWANGNEGGWNPVAEPVFREFDLQQRTVIRPDAMHGGFDTRHYPTWAELEALLDSQGSRYRLNQPLRPPPLILPTEMLHGLYDGGGAAGLAQYWARLSESPRFAGGFLWALLDEGVRRVDQPLQLDASGQLSHPIDTAGSYAPDGILGPYREPSASSRGVAQIFSSQSAPTAGTPAPRPRLAELTASATRDPKVIVSETSVTLTTDAVGTSAPAVEITIARAPGGDTRSQAKGIISLNLSGQSLPLSGGVWRTASASALSPRLIGEHFVDAAAKTHAVGSHRPWIQDNAQATNAVHYTQTFDNPAHSIRWSLSSEGLEITAKAPITADDNWAGLNFGLPSNSITTFDWIGPGPDRVWRNRRTGVIDHWRAHVDKASGLRGPVISMTHGERFDHLPIAGVYEMFEGRLLVQFDQDLRTPAIDLGAGFVGLFAPDFLDDAGLARANLPSGLTFYSRPPGIGTKFTPALGLEPKLEASSVEVTARFRFGHLEPAPED